MRLHVRALALFLGLGLWALPGRVLAQAVNGSLLGTITDSTNAVVPNAKVTMTEVTTNVTRSLETNSSGYYAFVDVKPGRYKVTVEMQGFRTAVRDNVDVFLNSTVRVDLTLTPGELRQTVDVTAAAPVLETDRADTGRKIDTRHVSELPLAFNHNFQNLINLVPGTTRAFRPHSQFFNPQDSLATQVNGQSRLADNLQLEGVDDNHRTGLLQILIPPIEAVQEVDVTTSNYEAELGRATGAVTNVMLKSGTNQRHGEIYEINHVSAMDARNFFDRGPSGTPFVRRPTTYNYYGGNVGGAIKKDKLFYFGDILRISDHRGQFWRFSVPIDAYRNGNFSSVSTKIYDPTTGDTVDCLPGGVASKCGTGRTQFVASSVSTSPNYNPACTSVTGCPNMIPVLRISPIANKILNLIPHANTSGLTQNFLGNTKFIKKTWAFDAVVDAVLNEANHLRFRYSFLKPDTTDPPIFGVTAGGPVNGGFQGTGVQKTHVAGVNWNRIFSPTLLAEFRIGVSRYRNDALNADNGNNTSQQLLGIPGANLNQFTSGISSISIDGLSDPLVGYSASLPWERAETNIDLVNHWTRNYRNHTIKWGADIRRVRDDLLQDQTFSPRGVFNFRTGTTSIPGAKTDTIANSMASFLLDDPNFLGHDLNGVFPAYRQWWIFFYGSDKWQVKQKLTLDLGLRWELYPPATPHFPGGFSNYDPNTNTLVLAGIGGNPLNLGLNYRYSNFAPRFGVAYRLSEKTIFRGGVGISYTPFPDNTYAYNFPVRQNNGFSNLNDFGPAVLPNGLPGSMASGFPGLTFAAIPSNGIIDASPSTLLSQSFAVINKSFKNPYVEAWNVAIQRSLPLHLALDVAYVGNHTVDAPTVWNLNAGLITGAGRNGQPLFLAFGKTQGVGMRFVGTSANYNALQVKLDRRFGTGLQLTTAYTWSKAMGITDEDGEPAYYVNFRRSYSRLQFDRTQTFVQSYIYELPFGKGQRWVTSRWGNAILGGWEVTGILTAMTGRPLNFGCSGCPGLNTPGNSQSADINGPFTKLFGVDTQPWFDTTVFSKPAANTFGNIGRFIFSGPGFFNFDAAVIRRIQLTEKARLEIRAEGFSVSNTPQFDNPNVSVGNVNFGLIKGAGGGRAIDFYAKLTF